MRKASATVTSNKNKSRWYARLQYYTPAGKRVGVCRSAEFKYEAEELLEELQKKYSSGVIDSRNKTFASLAEELKTTKYAAAKYSESGKKPSGVRNPLKAASTVKRLTDFFGEKKLSAISLGDLEKYRSERLQTVRIASANRELSLLRAMLNTAVRRKYLAVSPFNYAEPGELISVAAEDSRDVTITAEQEEALLGQCQSEGRRHSKALLITLIDSGCRLGELLRLKWSEVNFSQSNFEVTSYKGKNLSKRRVPLTSRTREAFLELRKRPSVNAFRKEDTDETLVFGITSNVKKSFGAARADAGLGFLRLHDLRHTAATRLASGGMNLAHVGQILGHSNIKRTQRYVNQTSSVLDVARDILEKRKA
jgi:integrase